LVEQVRRAATVPVAVGFGVGTPAQVARVGSIADGVIVGSRLVRAIADADTFERGLEAVSAFMGDARRALG
jgi:tryptophan synthase alpha chain